MNKRVVSEISPEHHRNEKRRPSFSDKKNIAEMDKLTGISIEILKKLLDDKNKELVQELPSKYDFQLLCAELSGLKIRQDEISERVVQLEKSNEFLETQLDKLMQKNTESNVVVHLPVEPNTDMQEKAKSICAGLLDKNDTSNIVESAYSVRARAPHTSTIIVKMSSRDYAWSVLRGANKLKGTKISIHKDLPPNVRQKRAKLVPIMQVLRKKNPEVKTVLRDDRLHVADKVFTWNLSKGLKCGEKCGFEVLKNLVGDILQPKQFMNELVNNFVSGRETSSMSQNVNAANAINKDVIAESRLGGHTSTSSHKA